ALLGERVDVGFVRGPIHEPALAAQTVLEEPLVAALPSGHRLGRYKHHRLAMLAGEPFVFQARSRGPGSHDQILAICQSAGFSPTCAESRVGFNGINELAKKLALHFWCRVDVRR